MSDFMGSASAVLAAAQHRVEVSAQNISNMSTPGYRRKLSFEQAMSSSVGTTVGLPAQTTSTDFTAGKAMETGDPLSLAIDGGAFFTLQGKTQALYTRDGQFHRDKDGRVVSRSGLPLQLQGGGDLVAGSGDLKVTPDGTVLQDDEPLGRIALTAFGDMHKVSTAEDGLFASSADNVSAAQQATVRQGALESSNVSTGDEMVGVMQALRSAEFGQRLVGVYDDLMGRAITTFAQQP